MLISTQVRILAEHRDAAAVALTVPERYVGAVGLVVVEDDAGEAVIDEALQVVVLPRGRQGTEDAKGGSCFCMSSTTEAAPCSPVTS